MRIARREQDDIQIVEFSGEVGKNDPSTVASLLENLICSGRKFIILDLEQVRFIDSSMVLALLRMKREALAAGGNIRLLRPRASVKKFLSIGQVLQLFECFETKIEAIRSFDPLKKRESMKRKGFDFADPKKTIVTAQQKTLFRLLELLVSKGLITNDEFMQELFQTSAEMTNVYRSELEERSLQSQIQPS